MCFRHIAQRTRTRHVADRIARSVTQNIVRHAHQSIFLAEHLAVLADDGQTVHIRIHYKTHIRFAALEQIADLGQMLWQRFRVMREMTVRGAVQLDDIFHTNCFQNSRNSQTAHRIDTINRYGEMAFLNSLNIYQRQFEHLLDVVRQIVFARHMA